MNMLILLLVLGRGACTVRTVRNVFDTDAAGGGDQRRRKPWREWTYKGPGPPLYQPEEWPDDDSPASWLKFAKKFRFVGERRTDLRRPCFYKGSLCT